MGLLLVLVLIITGWFEAGSNMALVYSPSNGIVIGILRSTYFTIRVFFDDTPIEEVLKDGLNTREDRHDFGMPGINGEMYHKKR